MNVFKKSLSALAMATALATTANAAPSAAAPVATQATPSAPVTTTTSPPQNPPPPKAEAAPATRGLNAISFEMLGRGGLYSLNYDRLLSDFVAVGAGVEYFKSAKLLLVEARQLTALPVYINIYPDRGENSFYLTIGVSYLALQARGGEFFNFLKRERQDEPFARISGVSSSAGIGYEYRPENTSGVLFRATAYWLWPMNQPWFGISWGASL